MNEKEVLINTPEDDNIEEAPKEENIPTLNLGGNRKERRRIASILRKSKLNGKGKRRRLTF